MEILNNNKEKIQYPYLERNDQIAILEDINRLMENEISNTSEIGDKKELFRASIRKALELSDRDIILFLKNKIIIKIFKKVEKLNPEANAPAQKDEEEQRYKGYNNVELENYYNEIFSELPVDKFLEELLEDLFLKEINFSKITNAYFEKSSITIINNAIADKLENILEEDGDFVAGFAGFVFRKHFFDIFEQIAIKLLKEIVANNENAKTFLSYYSGETIFENGKKYILPAIVTKMEKDGTSHLSWLYQKHGLLLKMISLEP